MTGDAMPWFVFTGERMIGCATEAEARAAATGLLERARDRPDRDGYWLDEDLTQTLCWGRLCQVAGPVPGSGAGLALRDAGAVCALRAALERIEVEIGSVTTAIGGCMNSFAADQMLAARRDGLIVARDLVAAALGPPED